MGDASITDEILLRVNQKGEREYSLDEIVSVVCARFLITEEKLKAPGKIRPMTEARAVAAAIVQMTPHVLLTDMAKLLNRDVSALGKAAHRVAGSESGFGTVREIVDTMRFAGSQMS